MTFPLTPERLQSIAVGCVTQFMNKQASLSEAIAKEAQTLELNPDQTKRVIEASNTIAYLRQLEKSADRTFEFEVADYDKVMVSMCVPEDMTKAAAEDKDKDEDKKKEDKKDKDKDPGDHEFRGDYTSDKDDKKKSEKDDDKDESKEQEKKAMLMQGYFVAKHHLTKMAYDKVEMHLMLTSAIETLHKDPLALEKLAQVTGSDFEATSIVCSLEKRAMDDKLVFVNSDLVAAKTVYNLYKEATALIAKEAELNDFITRADVILFHKEAGLGSLATDLIGAAVGGTVRGGASLATKAVKTLGAGGFAAGKKLGLTGIGTAIAGLGMTHNNNVRDI